MAGELCLSVFPGIDMLGRAMEEAGFCIVRGPDVIWGGDIKGWHIPAGKFDGIFGGPPCQSFSQLVHLVRANGHEPKFGNLFPEFERIVEEGQPRWFLTENVPAAPIPQPQGYWPARILILNNRWVGAEQNRRRRFCFGMRQDLEPKALDVSPDLVLLEEPLRFTVTNGNGFGNGSKYYARLGQAVLSGERNVPVKMGANGKVNRTYIPKAACCDTAGHGGGENPKTVRYSISEAARLQGFPELTLDDAPFTKGGKLKALANGVPKPMGLAIARAIRRIVDVAVTTADK